MAVDAGVGFVDILPRTEGFAAVLFTKISTAMRASSAKLGGEATALGRVMGSGLALPVVAGLAAVGVAVTKLASDFEDSTVRLRTLVGISAEETEHLSEAVLRLATEVPVAPKELADALFFITSAGQRGETAMETLRISAMAAASGLGETKVVADAVTSAMNSYAKSGLTAADATDILIKAVAEGKFPPEELAASLGNVLPIASQLGVEFEQVAAAIAAATKQGLAVNRAATGVRFLLAAFIKPSGAAVEALGRVGLSVEELQKSLADKGLLPTLQELAKRFDLTTAAGKEAFAVVVGGARGLSVATIQVGENADAVQKLTDNIANFAGTNERAFDVAMGTLTNRARLLGSTLQNVGIQVGNVLIPVVSSLVSLLGGLAGTVLIPIAENFKTLLTVFIGYKVLTFLPGLLLQVAVGLEAIGAAAVAGKVLSFAAALGALAGPVGIIAAIGAGLFVIDKALSASAERRLDKYRATIVRFGSDSEKSAGAIKKLTQDTIESSGALTRFGFAFGLPTVDEVKARVAAEIRGLDAEGRKAAILSTNILKLQKQADSATRGLGSNLQLIAVATGRSLTEFTGALRGALAKSQTDVRAWGQFVGETLSKAREFFADWRSQAADSLTGVGDVLSTLAGTANLTADKVLTAFEKATKATRDFTKDLLTIGKTGGQSGRDLAAALLQMGPSAAGLADVVASSGKDMRDKLVGQFGEILGAGQDGAGKLQKVLVGTLKDIRDILASIAKRWGITIDSNADRVKNDIDSVYNRLIKLDGTSVSTSIIVRTIGGGTDDPRQVGGEHGLFFAQHGGFVRKPTILAGEHHKQEAIVPLEDPSGISALSKALKLAGLGGDIHITVELDGEKVGRAVARRQSRRAALVGA
jgi:TP901 family phage tail tape measure protein